MEKFKKPALKFWVIFGAVVAVIYIAGHFMLTKVVCTPLGNIGQGCQKALELWPMTVMLPIGIALLFRLQKAGREIKDHHRQRSKWGNWKPPQ